MDPNAALRQIRNVIETLEDCESDAGRAACATDLADLVKGLDEWLSKGGFLPAAWRTQEVSWPQTIAGRTVWSCCVSNIGGPCAHKRPNR